VVANTLDSKTKRNRLLPRREPYWEPLQKGAALGFRKLTNGDGTWIARWRNDEDKQRYRALGNFNDFDDAAKAAREWVTSCEQGASPKATTVRGACEAYVISLRNEGRAPTASDAEGRFKRLIYDASIGKMVLDRLRTNHVTKWLNDQIDVDEISDDEDVRRSKDSANRNLSTFKAALNLAHRNRLVSTDAGWATVQSFPKVGARRRDAFLSMEQRKALLSACPEDLALFVRAALLTGARPGELANLNAGDFDKSLGALTLSGKTGARTVAISSAAVSFFTDASKSKLPSAPMLATIYGQRWSKDGWKKIFKTAASTVKLPEAVVMYSLRHTAISEMILAGMDSFVVAKLTGTSVSMIEKNYGHLRHSAVTAKLDRVVMI
jgi:integrase